MRLCVLGAGYVGLPLAACLADDGHDVLGIDASRDRIDALMRGACPVQEPGLAPLVQRNTAAGRLAFGTSLPAGERFEAYILAVGTPAAPDGSLDLTDFDAALDELAESFASAHAETKEGGGSQAEPVLLLIRSTVPAGTTLRTHARLQARLLARLRGHAAHVDVRVVFSPEFLRQGHAVADTLRPTRLVVGYAGGPEDATLVRRLFSTTLAQGTPVFEMDATSAELAKLASNAMLATRVSFMNKMASLCEAAGGDIEHVRRAMGADPRIGGAHLEAGLGFGGACLPKDVDALRAGFRAYGLEPHVLDAVQQRNACARALPLGVLAKAFEGTLVGRTVALWGVAFKPGTGDVRCSVALSLARALLEKGARLRVHDPLTPLPDFIREVLHTWTPGPDGGGGHEAPVLEAASTPLDAARGADAILLLTASACYADVSGADLARAAPGALVVDGRNALARADLEAYGLRYQGVGR